MRIFVQRAMQADNVRSSKEFSESIDVYDAMLLSSITRIRIVGDNCAAKAFRKYLACQQSNLPRADDANGLSRKIESHKTIKKEVAFANAIVSFVIFSNYSQHHPDSKLCDRLGGIWRYTNNLDTELDGRVEVDVIVTRTPKCDIFLNIRG